MITIFEKFICVYGYSEKQCEQTTGLMRSEVFTVVEEISVLVFWVAILCGLVGRHLFSSEMLISTYKSTQCYNPKD
jgi:hypothetical protein